MKSQWQQQIYRKAITILLALSGIFTTTNLKILAQLKPDNTLGSENSIVNQVNEVKDLIEGGATRGTNLFHSFEKFNVGENRSVYFSNPTGIENILTRVTGGNISNILGTLGVEGSANLFLINPHGIYFGKDAVLDIRGSFTATTADEIKLGENGLFSAINPQSSNLLTVQPSALFRNAIKNQVAEIRNEGKLQVGQNLTFDANNIYLSGKLQAGNDLTLQANNTLQIRDNITQPFIASAGGNLLIQGNQLVDIFALNHPHSGLFSGGNMILRSANTVGGDAHYYAGGNFQIEQLDGKLGNLYSPDDPIIRTIGDVLIGAYEGPSLHIISGGKVEINDIYITGVHLVGGLQENITLSDGSVINIDGTIQPTLDIRAGVKDTAIGSPFIVGNGLFFYIPLSFSVTKTSANINIGSITNNRGTVFLTNQYQPNTLLPGGEIKIGEINTSSGSGGGNVTIDSRSNITLTGNINSYSYSASGDAGDGGAINLIAGGDISTQNLNSYSHSINSGNTGNGGEIKLTSGQNISVLNLDATAYSPNSGNTQNAGKITLNANGNINTKNLYALSYSASGNAGNGGEITFNTEEYITTQNLFSYSYSRFDNTGNGGAIALTSTGDITTGDLNSRSYSPDGKAGNGGDIALTTTDGDITTAKIDSRSLSYSTQGNVGSSGNINLTTTGGNISTTQIDSSSYSSSGTQINGGVITLRTTNGDIKNLGDLTSGNNLNISANNLDLQGELIARNDIQLQANNNLTIKDRINSPFIASAGNDFLVSANNLELQGQITAKHNIKLQANNDLTIKASSENDVIFLENNLRLQGQLIAKNDITLQANNNIAIQDGSNNPFITSTGNNLLVSGNNLELQGQLIAKNDITLQANNNITIQDSINNPFIASTGNDLLIQGNQKIEISALNNLNSNFTSDRNIIFSSPVRLLSNARYTVGNYFITKNLDGSIIDLLTPIPIENVIKVDGDITLTDYTGPSLFILASGKVNLGNITINNTAYGAGQLISDGQGGMQTVNIGDKNSLSTLDVKAGIDTQQIPGGLPKNPSIPSDVAANFGNPSSANINIGSININSGVVFLTNQYHPNRSLSGNITVTDTTGNGAIVIDGNRENLSINLDSKGDITLDMLQDILLSSVMQFLYTNGGAITLNADGNINIIPRSGTSQTNGGAITLNAGGNINTTSLLSSVLSSDDGGNITLNAGGDITTDNLVSSSIGSSVFNNNDNAGNGGAITLNAGGNITTNNLFSISVSDDEGKAGNGGAINIHAKNGNIDGNLLYSFSVSQQLDTGINAGNGGNVTLEAKNTISNIEIQTLSSDSQSGLVQITGFGDLEIKNTGILTSKQLDINIQSGNGANSGFNIDVSRKGQSGDINITSNGNINLQNSRIESDTKGSDSAGNVSILTPGFITLNNSQISTNTSNIGKAGSISIEANQGLTLDSLSSLAAKTNNTGNAGNITLKAPQLNLETGAKIEATTENIGNAGNITLQPETNGKTFNLNLKEESLIASSTSNEGKGGNLIITAPDLVKIEGIGKLFAGTSGKGDSGNIQIDTNLFNLENVEISASTTADGKAGDITLNTPTLTVSNGGKIIASTSGSGQGGTITVNAPNEVNLGIGVQDSSPVLSVETSGAEKAGNIIVNTPTLTVSDTARITATATATATNTEGGGSITLNASKMNLAGVVGVFAETQGQAPAGTLQLNPYQNQPDLDITLFPNSTISASTTAAGKGGDLIITAPENINIAGQGKLAVESTGSGDAGNIFVTTQNFNITDGVKISASTSKTGRGGNINVNANKFAANNSAQLLTTTSGNNQAGNINLQVRDNITLDGTNTGLFANTELGSTGKSGNITIDPEIFIIKNGAGIGVNSRGSGEGGNISIAAGTLRLDNQGFISAETASNQGGNINLNIQDFLFLRNNSKITATAGTAGAGGDGGNININAPFIIAFSSENSDITANAFQGNGGRINITTNAIFGLEYRPQLTPESDITASSDFGLAGEVQINTPDVDPTSGLIELPENLVDAASLVGKDICAYEQRAKKSSFTIIGRGGIPAEADELISNSPGMVEWLNRSDANTTTTRISKSEIGEDKESLKNPVIQEAQGWIITNDGRVILTATSPQVIPQSSGLNHPSCK